MPDRHGRERQRSWHVGGRRHQLAVEVSVEPGVDVVILAGELDTHTHDQLRDVFRGGLLEQPHAVLDLAAVTFVDSSGLGAIVVCHTAAVARGAQVQLVADQPHLLRLFALTRLDQTIPVRHSRDEALRRLL